MPTFKKDQDGGIGIDITATVEATTYELTDKEFDDILRSELKRYMRDKLGAMKVTKLDTANNFKDVRLKVSQQIPNPEFASVATDYISLRSQEKQAEDALSFQQTQAKTNFRLQWMLIGLAALSVFTSLVQLAIALKW